MERPRSFNDTYVKHGTVPLWQTIKIVDNFDFLNFELNRSELYAVILKVQSSRLSLFF